MANDADDPADASWLDDHGATRADPEAGQAFFVAMDPAQSRGAADLMANIGTDQPAIGKTR